jgi:hypothetical protein
MTTTQRKSSADDRESVSLRGQFPLPNGERDRRELAQRRAKGAAGPLTHPLTRRSLKLTSALSLTGLVFTLI